MLEESQNPLADNDSSRPGLPVIAPSAELALQRTQTAVNLLRDIVQESSAEYWYERGKAASAHEESEEAVANFQTCLSINGEHWRAMIQLVVALVQQAKHDEATNYFEQIYSEPKISWLEFTSELSTQQWKSLGVLGADELLSRTAGVRKILIGALISYIAGGLWLEDYICWLIDSCDQKEYEQQALFHWLEGRMRAEYNDYYEARISYSRCLYRQPNFIWAEHDMKQLPEIEKDNERYDDPFAYMY